ncbi:baseplate multidomain protein megatron [Falsirhodobacter halotolerans]|uniref:baseplate multidomain protein megatron n=1 Tax=Falsirhodobacter halotolerans TaxID=1146892 RepID=UPI001FD3F177|nr:glycoside hydrolase/phage tail family protein [Falsirhodobacter halotolerans]MCJ8139308.1 glycoside hydrolase/phage tail family protein [Falsirhodobacter halotolerans]
MATLLLAGAGAAIGGGFGGTLLGLSGAVLGRAVGATLGQVIDQRLLGGGSDRIETGRLERYRIMGAGEGAPIPYLFGRTRVAGQVIWATRFREDRTTTSGRGKGAKPQKVTEYSYSVSIAVALCEGEIASLGRIWADGIEIPAEDLNLRLYTGRADQLADPKIEAVEGAGMAPAYRGTAYVVLEDLGLARFGNRIPQFSFEVMRPAEGDTLQTDVRAVAMIPGTGEYALATSRVTKTYGLGVSEAVNVNSPSGKSDLETSLDLLGAELPKAGSVAMVVSWFGNDLRAASCEVRPKVEQVEVDGSMRWRVAGVSRRTAKTVPQAAGRPVYGGTPSDQSVIEGIRAIRSSGREVMFYPFILMEQMADNTLPDPWSGDEGQAVLPWRGRITSDRAPGRDGTTDRTDAARMEVEAFFGTVKWEDYGSAGYSGPDEWRYRRFILHYAHLCALAGGVDAFCIGSEMRGLTSIRGAGDTFPAVEALCRLAADVREILPDAKISYAADWSEYFGYHADGDVYFHLDPLWAHPAIDFVGIDNYMPLSDWRDGDDHADAAWGSIYSLDYLTSNVAGGEGYDWYYDGAEGIASQNRLPITDGAHDEAWVFRYKDIRNWWSRPHHERRDGARMVEPTAWVPQSKPIRFTEYGCAAIDRGTNEPNKFLDPKSSESVLPRMSNGRRDDLIQMQYLRAVNRYWGNGTNNPTSPVYGGRMIDMDRAHVWAWDARPFPAFPNLVDLWSDGENYPRGHWLNGRASSQPLASVVAEICRRAGVRRIDVSDLFGIVRGYSIAQTGSARAALQPLMLAHGFDAIERQGTLCFRMRGGGPNAVLNPERLAITAELDGTVDVVRASEAEMTGHIRLGFVGAEGDYAVQQVEAVFPDEVSHSISQSDLDMVLTAAEARGIAERWLAEARIARNTTRFALPWSVQAGAGDTVSLNDALWRIDRMERGECLLADAVRVEPHVHVPSDAVEERVVPRAFVAPVPTFPLFLDLPLLRGTEVAHAPHVAVTATPWPGTVAVWSAMEDAGYSLNRLVERGAVIGVTEDPLLPAPTGVWDMGAPLRVRMFGGTLASASDLQVLNGANAMAIGDGSPDGWEVFQFADAVLSGEGVYDLRRRLRGQLGTEATIPVEGWPAGSYVVLLNDAVQQIDLAPSARSLARHYRIGGAQRGYDDPSVVHQVLAFPGVGLRPYAPVHLRGSGDKDVRLTWVRRTRIDGDSWESYEVPLGEAREEYLIRVSVGGQIRREVTVSGAEWTYTAAMKGADGVAGTYHVEVAQISDRFGPGAFARLTLT